MKRILVAVILASALAASLAAPAAAADAPAALEKAKTLLTQGKPGQALIAAEEALAAIWDQAPFHLRNVTLVERKAPMYGMFTPRKDNVYPAGQSRIVIYMEPRAYKFRKEPQGYSLGVAMDIYLLDPSGKVLFGREGFLRQRFTSRHRVREMMLNATLTLSGAPAGQYLIKLVVHDLNSKATATAKVPIVLQ